MKQQRFKIRAAINGTGVWVCPDCGYQQRLHLSPKTRWRVQCTHEDCQHVFRVGLVFYRPLVGERDTRRPPDTLVAETIPESLLAPAPYRSGFPVHQLRREEKTLGE